MGWGRWCAGGDQAKGNRAHLALCLSNIQTSLTCQGNVSSEIPPQFCCQSCTAIQHQSDVSGSDDIILTVVMHYASNSISCEWSSFVFNEFSVRVCVCTWVCMCVCACTHLYFGQVNPIRFHFQ